MKLNEIFYIIFETQMGHELMSLVPIIHGTQEFEKLEKYLKSEIR
jgi:hypothetical protein